ncbi:MAG: DNA/RNA non-specific endonuclease [Clostridia bacterium]|nr:DNA/RNA non-specific endonuclease [Clostridia bacterium]
MTTKLRTTTAIISIILTCLVITAFIPTKSSIGDAASHIGQGISHELQQTGTGSNPDLAAALALVTGADRADEFEVPEFSGNPYVKINNNEPEFDEALMTEESFEDYGRLDRYGRCTTAIANISVDTEPGTNEERGDISEIHPTGWMSNQGWERCHLIGWQLTGENANARNLVTGTHYMNVSGMQPFENRVHWYIEDTGNHVVYQVTPVFEGKNKICSGVHMQARSVEDKGWGISFNVFCFNVSPGKEIDYMTGLVTVANQRLSTETEYERSYVVNTNSMKFHYPTCSSVKMMSEHNKKIVTESREELIKEGYLPCGNCEP